ncbi:hypothetical protein DFJ74DRAFT_730260 [Hyaloraphidium curvatum]|nr:hypothetical protein DFJ74DRAFT_730260 [Hyaloraphidium curvatum]
MSEPPSGYCPPIVSFLWIFTGLIILFMFMVIVPWVFVLSRDWDDVVKEHSTISSYCAYPRTNHWFACRLFVVATVGLAVSLMGLTLEEYNSRGDETVIFILDLLFSFSIALVGIFPSYKEAGSPGSEKRKSQHVKESTVLEAAPVDAVEEQVRGGCYKFRSLICPGEDGLQRASSFLHMVGALMFWTGHSTTNTIFVVQLALEEESWGDQWAVALVVLCATSWVSFFGFLGLQGYIGTLSTERSIDKKGWNAMSFTVEAFLVIVVTVTTVIATQLSNKYFGGR